MLLRFASFWLFPLLGAALLWGSARVYGAKPIDVFLFVAAGFAAWTLLEYWLHRVIFHKLSQHPPIRRWMGRRHLQHHGNSHDAELILVAPLGALVLSLPLGLVLYAILTSPSQVVGVLCGVWLGLLYYELVHYRVHRSKRDGPLLNSQRRNHFYHHFVDDGFCFGVTSPTWDVVFGTYRRVEQTAGERR
jgi:sterol desaturase/sphingolipid hydroxylase (fatty acid hydroxylase superfamily)